MLPAPIQRLISLCVIQSYYINDKKLIFLNVKGLGGAIFNDVPLFSQHGVISVPKIPSLGILLAINGDSETPICVAIRPRQFPKLSLAQGETGIVGLESFLKLGADCELNGEGPVNINSGGPVEINSGDTLNALASGELSLSGKGLKIESNGIELLAALIEFFTAAQTAMPASVGTAAGQLLIKLQAMS